MAAQMAEIVFHCVEQKGPIALLDICRSVNSNKKAVNKELYVLRQRGRLVKVQECNPPTWDIPRPVPYFRTPASIDVNQKPKVGFGSLTGPASGDQNENQDMPELEDINESLSAMVVKEEIKIEVVNAEGDGSSSPESVVNGGRADHHLASPPSLSFTVGSGDVNVGGPAAPEEGDLRERILSTLRECPSQRSLVVSLSRRLGYPNKKQINPTLYKLAAEGRVVKVQDTPPIWQLVDHNPGAARAHMRHVMGMAAPGMGAPGMGPSAAYVNPIQAMNNLNLSGSQNSRVAVHANPLMANAHTVPVRPNPANTLTNTSDQDFYAALNNESFASLNKNPISAFLEFCQGRGIEGLLEVVRQSGPPHNPTFVIAARMGNRTFPAVTAGNKKDGRRDAADRALRVLMSEGQYQVAANPQPCVKIAELGLKLTEFDRIAGLAHMCFTELSASIPESLSGRKVLAALVMKRDDDDEGRVISLGTGNRCVGGDCLSMEGHTVNDSHAEVITRRAFMRFVYQNLLNHAPGASDSLFQEARSPRGKLQLREGLSFHFYISVAPCGDSALMTPRAAALNIAQDLIREHQPTFNSEPQGLLRTKIERGEGAVRIEPDFPGLTWDGVLRGERLLTMSCSDKVCRWNVLGLQGALLSHFIEPIYMNTLTLGYLFDHGHLSRASCCRLAQGTPHINDSLPDGYELKHPLLGRVTAYEPPRETEKTKNTCVNWSFGEAQAEVTDGTTGRVSTAGISEGVSRLSKSHLFSLFTEVCQRNKDNHLLGKTYYHSKKCADDYQVAKAAMVSEFQQRNYGTWIKKPMEQELFCVEQQGTEVFT